MFWRVAEAALEAGCLDTIFDLSIYKQALIVATVEEKRALQNVVEYDAKPKDEE